MVRKGHCGVELDMSVHKGRGGSGKRPALGGWGKLVAEGWRRKAGCGAEECKNRDGVG